MKNKTKKKIIGAVVGTTTAGVIAFAGWVGCAFFGNPVTKYQICKSAEEYVAEKYPDENFEIVKCTYDFKSCDYYVTAQSPTSEDTRFSIWQYSDGSVEDNYLTQPINNTIARFGDAMREEVEPLLEEEFGNNTELFVRVMCEENTQVVFLDQPVDLDNFPFEIKIQLKTFKGDKTEDEMVQETVDRINKAINGKYTVGEYTFYYPRGDGGNTWITVTAEELESKTAS